MTGASARIDLSAIRHNVALFADMVADARICAVVKADGYGHGAAAVAGAAVEAGATWLAVATIEEAIEIACSDVADDVPLMILSERPALELRSGWSELPKSKRLMVASEWGARLIDSLADDPVPVHIKVDTGMHRVGVAPGGAVALADLVSSLPGLVLEGVCTHFAVADDPGDPFTDVQIQRFDSVVTDLAAAGHHPEIVHMANSAATITRPDTHHNLVRLGISMYGAAALKASRSPVAVRPAMSLTSSITSLHGIEAGESVSYGRKWFADTATTIATFPLGYADGVSRSSAAAGIEVLVGGRRCPMVGVVTMDQTMVVVDDDTLLGDEVVLIGGQGDQEITVDEIARRLGTIGYEVLVGLGRRITRTVVG